MVSEVQSAYRDLENLIIYGFLTARMSISNQTILLKGITDREFSLFDMIIPYSGEDKDHYLFQLSYSTVFINELNCLRNRESNIPDLVEFYRRMPISALDVIRRTISNLNDRTVNVLDYLEGYCYSPESRSLWKILDLEHRDSFAALPGVSEVGVNVIQRNWAMVNQSLDKEDEYETMFNLAVFISSSMNSKGAKDVSRSHAMRRRELEELREEITKYGVDRKRREKKESGWASPLNSKEDLVRELQNQMEGKKDKHDLFIEEWARRQREKSEEAKRQAELRQQEYREKIQDVDLTTIEGSRPVSVEELRKALEKQRQSQSEEIKKRKIEGSYNSEMKDRVIRKIGSTILKSGNN